MKQDATEGFSVMPAIIMILLILMFFAAIIYVLVSSLS